MTRTCGARSPAERLKRAKSECLSLQVTRHTDAAHIGETAIEFGNIQSIPSQLFGEMKWSVGVRHRSKRVAKTVRRRAPPCHSVSLLGNSSLMSTCTVFVDSFTSVIVEYLIFSLLLCFFFLTVFVLHQHLSNFEHNFLFSSCSRSANVKQKKTPFICSPFQEK
jgi:hypothetical protein